MTLSPPLDTIPVRSWRPWRSASLGWFLTAIVLSFGLPIFLCMPPWTDVTLYDVAVRAILHGGVHYRDVFDTNLPGIVWIMAAIRATCGTGYVALRAWDLVFVGGAVTILGFWARRSGASTVHIAWYALAVALFYPFTSEFNHCQRDPWMLFPAVVAGFLRMRRVTSGEPAAPGIGRVALRAFVEGIIWGIAVWIKPHVMIPGAAIVLLSYGILGRAHWRMILADFGGLLLGGLLMGAAGMAYLIGSGTWPHFYEIVTTWNPEYFAQTMEEVPYHLVTSSRYFAPWSLVHVVALPVAARMAMKASMPGRGPAGLLAALYMAWYGQAFFLQKGLDYVHIPEVLLALAVLAIGGWNPACVAIGWFAAMVILFQYVTLSTPWVARYNANLPGLCLLRHPMTEGDTIRAWPRCFTEGSTPQLRDVIGQYVDVHCGTRWEDIDGVASYLRTVDPPLRDGELTCFHDSTNSLYLTLDTNPSTRYMHFGTAFGFRARAEQVGQEVAMSKQRYVVSDLKRMTWYPHLAYVPGRDGRMDALPDWFPVSQRDKYPWNQPIVFRSGRYVVHHVIYPIGVVDVPEWKDLGDLGPGL